MSWFNCVIKYDKMNEQGAVHSISEQILIDAINFTEVENNVTSYKADEVRGLFQITKITHERIEEIVNLYDNFEYWFKGKVTVKDIDDSGKEKKFTKIFYISADTLEHASELFRTYLDKIYLVDTIINSISITNVSDVLLSTNFVPSNLKKIEAEESF